ncbi:Uncharacterized protein ToN1_40830 [Aromatoleum petrolei]|nr:Uncharacterized protein ToN1_40830 [Aromatoleum petrolei]
MWSIPASRGGPCCPHAGAMRSESGATLLSGYVGCRARDGAAPRIYSV